MTKKDKMPLINGIVFTILGLVIFIYPDSIITFVSYFLGGLLIAIGLYKTANYYIQNKRFAIVNQNELYFGVTAIVLGIVIIILGIVVELLLRLTIGCWLIVAGLLRIVSSFYTNERNNKFYGLLVVGSIFIIAGIYTLFVSNIAIQLLGVFMLLYGIIDFISYFIYNGQVIKTKRIEIKEADIIEKE